MDPTAAQLPRPISPQSQFWNLLMSHERLNNALKVSELIKLLQTLPPNSLCLTRGYKGGMEAITKATPRAVYFDADASWYYGPYDEAAAYDLEDSNLQGPFNAIQLES